VDKKQLLFLVKSIIGFFFVWLVSILLQQIRHFTKSLTSPMRFLIYQTKFGFKENAKKLYSFSLSMQAKGVGCTELSVVAIAQKLAIENYIDLLCWTSFFPVISYTRFICCPYIMPIRCNFSQTLFLDIECVPQNASFFDLDEGMQALREKKGKRMIS